MSLKNLSIALFLVLLVGMGGVRSAHAQSARPCDIYAAASPATPCVAAFSTTRALYSTYTGSLYQVTRQSDNTTTNIGVLSDGYANASVQDAFCAGTTCTITKLYDQSSNHNDLTPAPPGQNGSGAGPNHYDLPASATALPIVIGGHNVYGILISPGMGYRNNATKNIATGSQPEGVYMVSSVLEVPTGTQCCFDFGNAETDNNDDNYGAMDAMNLIIDNTGSPAAGLDMENGVPGDFKITAGTQFVTAMGWNNGTTNFKIYWGNAQSGDLMSTIARALPTQYQPMKKQGAIILGIGGDNSNYGPGYFFEGAMTTGTPSDASMNAVQASIVAAAYAGPVTLNDGDTYTFRNEASQLALDNGGVTTNGAAVVQNAVTYLASQQWTVHAQANGYFTMVNKGSGLCLDDPFGNGTPSRTLPQSAGTSTMLWQQPCNGAAAQNWLFIPQSDGSYVIEDQGSTTHNAGNQMVIDVFFGESTAGLQMWLDTANGLSPQKWVVSSDTASNLALSGVPPSVFAGVAQSLTVKAKASSGSVIPPYTGTVHFTSTDPNAVLPADYAFTSSDADSHMFSITLKTTGASECITASDSADSLSSQVCTAVTAVPTQTTVSTSANPSNSNAAVVLNAKITITGASLPTAPTGTVTFYSGTTVLGRSTSLAGSGSTYTATYSAAAGTLPVGSDSITASYSGDSNYLASTSTAVTQTVNLSAFSMTATPTSLTIQNGQSGMVTLTLTSVGNYASPSAGITFNCNPLPLQSSCSASGASSITLNSGATATVNLVIQTKPTMEAAIVKNIGGMRLPLLALLPAGLLLPFAFGRRRRRWSSAVLALLLLGFGLNLLSGCSGAASTKASVSGTPVGTTSVMVYATDGTITKSVPVMVIVQ